MTPQTPHQSPPPYTAWAARDRRADVHADTRAHARRDRRRQQLAAIVPLLIINRLLL